MKVVLDTNIIISAFLWQKNVKEIFDLVRYGKIRICANTEILNEIKKVFEYPKFHSQLNLLGKSPEEIIDEFMEIIELYSVPADNSEIIVKSDPSDDKFLYCALASDADFIISGDKHLLKLKSFQNIPILTPRQFLNRFKKTR